MIPVCVASPADPEGHGAAGQGGLFVVDDRQRVLEWSDGAAALTGIPATLAIDRPCYELLQGRGPSGCTLCRRGCAPLEALRQGRVSSRAILADHAGRALAPIRCEVMALPWQFGGALGRLEPCSRPGAGGRRDVVRDLSALATLATSLSTVPFPRGLEQALAALREATHVESVEAFLADPGRRGMLLVAYAGPFRSAFFQTLRFGPGEGFPGLVLERRAPVATRALEGDARYLRSRVKARGFRSYVCAPLTGPDGMIGALGAASRRADVDLEAVLRILAWAGVLVGAAMHACLVRAREALSAEALEAAADEESLVDRVSRRALEQALDLGNADGGRLLLLGRRADGPAHLVTAGLCESAVCPGLLPGAVPSCPALATGLGVSLYGPRRDWPLPCRGGASRKCVAGSCLPMRAGGRPIGVIHLAHRTRCPSPPTRSLGLLAGLADSAAQILEKTQMRAEQRRRLTAPLRPSPAAQAEPPAGEPLETGDEACLAIRCLGPFELRRRGLLVTADVFPRRKALTLLKILLVHGRQVPKETLMEWLWPEVDPEAGAGRLHVVVHALRQVLEPAAAARASRFVQGDADGYRFDAAGACLVDLEELRVAIAAGERAERAGEPDAAILAYDEAARLYRGDLLEDEPSAEWCGMEREQLRETFLGVLKRLASLHVRAGDLEQAIERYRRALQADALREEIHQKLIDCLWRAGRRDEALRQYRVCRDLLQHELGVRPLPETERLVERVRAAPPR